MKGRLYCLCTLSQCIDVLICCSNSKPSIVKPSKVTLRGYLDALFYCPGS